MPEIPTAAPVDPSFYDRDAIFHDSGPLHPAFMEEAIRSLLRACPLDPTEPERWAYRRMESALNGLAALHPRDEIEVMLGVQAIAAYHAANACWRIGMNLRLPNGDSTRHLSSAASAARTFETMLRALERRQAKPLAVPAGRPPPRVWPDHDPGATVQYWETRCRKGEDMPIPNRLRPPKETVAWTSRALAIARQMRDHDQLQMANDGLDIAGTEGILPSGGMVVPEEPTPQQVAYMVRRTELMYRREWQDNVRKGIKRYPRIRPLRVGDLVP
jgi:hypothetical protein